MSNTRETTFSPQKDVMKTILYLQKKYVDEIGENIDAEEIYEHLDTLRRLVSGMSERAYRVHIEDSEKQGSFFRKLTTTVSLFLLFSIPGFAQMPTMATPDQYAAIASMHLSDSADFDTTYVIGDLPTMLRSHCVNLAFEEMSTNKFEVWQTPLTSPPDFTNTFLKSKGMCRGLSFSLPVKEAGIYTAVFSAAALQITVTPADSCEGGHIVHLKFNYR